MNQQQFFARVSANGHAKVAVAVYQRLRDAAAVGESDAVAASLVWWPGCHQQFQHEMGLGNTPYARRLFQWAAAWAMPGAVSINWAVPA